jgi:hypothetical protein
MKALIWITALAFAMSFTAQVFAGDSTPKVGDPAAAEAAQGSAKMGEEAGTQTGTNQGSKPENDTKKIDQDARKNTTTGN